MLSICSSGAGLDFLEASQIGQKLAAHDDVARRAKILKKQIVEYQDCMTSLELCRKPVLAAVHSACVGAGVDMITAADMRYCTQDAWFQVKEVGNYIIFLLVIMLCFLSFVYLIINNFYIIYILFQGRHWNGC